MIERGGAAGALIWIKIRLFVFLTGSKARWSFDR
jgi:hypothetical protein